MITGSCLCGAVRFEVQRFVGPFELCHCPRCRKVSGSAFMAGLGVRVEDFRLICGNESIRHFELPIRDRAPAYSVSFCAQCGSPVPDPPASGWFEIAAGLLDQDPGLTPDKHIYVEGRAPWFEITDTLPQYSAEAIAAFRRSLLREESEEGEGEEDGKIN